MAAATARVETPDAAPSTPALSGPIGSLFKTDKARALITPLLRGVSYDQVVSETYILLKKKPDLLKCTGESILWSVADCLRLKLVFGETAHMVPFNTKVKYFEADDVDHRNEKERWEDRAQCIVGWKGAIELVVRSGAARDVDAQNVYENELVYPDARKNFDVRYGSDPDVNHYPQLRDGDRGRLVGAYAVARLNQTQKKVLWMPIEEIEAIRQTFSKQHKRGVMPPWYPRKTLVLHLCNRLPRNAQLDEYLKIMQRDPEIDEVEEIQAHVTDAPASPAAPAQRMLGQGAMRPIESPEQLRARVMSDDERIEMANRYLNRDEDDDPRPRDGFQEPF